jgi:hypothetical protein
MKDKLDWPDLWQELGMEKDSGWRWYPGDDTPTFVVEYLSGYRSPSRAHPFSYARALLTRKFAKHLIEIDKELAAKVGLVPQSILLDQQDYERDSFRMNADSGNN